MRGVWNGLIAVLLACQIAVQASPENESVRKGVRLICGLAVLLTLLIPLRNLADGAEEIWRAADSYLELERRIDADSAADADPYAAESQAILAYAAERAGISRGDLERAELTLVTEESGEVREIQLFLASCPEAARMEIEETIGEAYEIPVFIFTKPGADDEQNHG